MHSSTCRTFIIKHQSLLFSGMNSASNNHPILMYTKASSTSLTCLCVFLHFSMHMEIMSTMLLYCWKSLEQEWKRNYLRLLLLASYRWDWMTVRKKVWIFARIEIINWCRNTRWAIELIRNSFEWKNFWWWKFH